MTHHSDENKVVKIPDLPNSFYSYRVQPGSIWTEPTMLPNIRAAIKPLVKELAKQRPRWTFYVEAYASGALIVKVVEVFQDGEYLGKFYTDWNDTDRIHIDNHRLTQKRQRGNSNHSTKLKSQLKIVLDNFAPLTLNERHSVALGKAHSATNAANTKVHYPFVRKTGTLHEELFNAVIRDRNLNTVKLSEEMTQRLQEWIAEKELMDELTQTIGAVSKMTYIAFSRPHSYYIRPNGNVQGLFDPNDPPASMREAIGMLKLVEDMTVVPMQGVRVDAYNFFVMEKEEKEEKEDE